MRQHYERIIKEALDNPELLTDWENEFIDSIAEREEGYTAKQMEVLDKIEGKLE